MHSNKKDTPEKYIWQLESKWPRFTHRLRMQLSMIHICLSKTLSVCFSQLVNVLSEEQKPNFSSSRNFNLKIKKKYDKLNKGLFFWEDKIILRIDNYDFHSSSIIRTRIVTMCNQTAYYIYLIEFIDTKILPLILLPCNHPFCSTQ